MPRIKLFGVAHRKGISKKTGNPYDFGELHMAVPKHGVVGEAAEQKIVDASFCDLDRLVPGIYEADFDSDGNLLSLSPVQQPSK